MLSKADNEILVRTGPGTMMGNLYRRFWAPILLESELGGPDAPPVRVNVLGEKLVAFRDTNGAIGLLYAYCPHRRANMYWGRNEEAGLRCVYHGWKFDVNGQCTDLPNCPEGENLKAKVRTPAYPTLERGGIIWAYLGPPELQPEFPHAEAFATTDPSRRHITKIHIRANFAQVQEGDVDSSHVSFLHSSAGGEQLAGSRANPNTFADKSPRWFTMDTDYGMMLSAQRNAGPDRFQWRVNQWLMPFATLIAAAPGAPILAQLRVPIDDESSYLFRVLASPDRPLTAEERASYDGGVMVPAMIPGTTQMRESADNDYLIDRDAQRTRSYTGIRSIVAQDLAVSEDQNGPIADRSDEYLTSSDRAIIALRKRLLASAKALADGTEPPEARAPKAYRVRPGDFMLPRDVPVVDGAKDILLIGAR
jgi:phenylpropionate dioxygenase-like ring-hydroxylating dioxygenase large terminal subunit